MLACEETVGKQRCPLQPQSKRCSGMVLGGSSPSQGRRTCSTFSSAKSYKASQSSRVMDAKQQPAPLGDASVAWSVSQGSARKFVSNQGASPVRSSSSSSRTSRSVDIVCLAAVVWLQCRTHRGWRILLVYKRWRRPTLPGGAARSVLRPQQRSAS